MRSKLASLLVAFRSQLELAIIGLGVIIVLALVSGAPASQDSNKKSPLGFQNSATIHESDALTELGK